jgi:ABC-type polysaccharide/polyol phosphate export permease
LVRSPTVPSLRRSLQIQARVLWALLLREIITRFGRRNLGVLWLVLEPMLFTLGVAALWSAARAHQLSAIPIIAFAITGYSSVLMWRNTVGHCVSAIQSNLNLLYHRNVQPIDVFLARIALEVGGATASFVVLSVLFTALELITPPVDLLLVVAGWLMLGWFGAALGLLVGAATSFSELVKRLWTPTAYLLFPLSGAAFMVDWLPPASREFILLLPMVHGVEMLREGYFGGVVPTHYDAAYMAGINLVLTFLGLALVRLASRRVEAD